MEEDTLPLSGKCCFQEVNGIWLLQIDRHVNAGISTSARTTCVCVRHHSSWRNQLPGERQQHSSRVGCPDFALFRCQSRGLLANRTSGYQYKPVWFWSDYFFFHKSRNCFTVAGPC